MADDKPDPYARSEYRRLIAWESRIRREQPFLSQLLEQAPEPSVLDLGCGSGEHTAFFARLGARAVGLDRSTAMIETAKDHEARGEGRFVLGDATHARTTLATELPFGLCICLGNMLPHIQEPSEVQAIFREVRELLVPGGKFLLQILNYQRILEKQVRSLPISFRPGEKGQEIVFLRLLKADSKERLLFFPTTLSLNPEAEEPVTVKVTRRVELRPWTSPDLVPQLEDLGFSVIRNGDMEGGEFVPLESTDLVLVATRS